MFHCLIILRYEKQIGFRSLIHDMLKKLDSYYKITGASDISYRRREEAYPGGLGEEGMARKISLC